MLIQQHVMVMLLLKAKIKEITLQMLLVHLPNLMLAAFFCLVWFVAFACHIPHDVWCCR